MIKIVPSRTKFVSQLPFLWYVLSRVIGVRFPMMPFGQAAGQTRENSEPYRTQNQKEHRPRQNLELEGTLNLMES